ncbi:protein of unknown function [Methanocaldococcus lauensis]|nr:protein of unknown function [Methanocaldococcus lauensis]
MSIFLRVYIKMVRQYPNIKIPTIPPKKI